MEFRFLRQLIADASVLLQQVENLCFIEQVHVWHASSAVGSCVCMCVCVCVCVCMGVCMCICVYVCVFVY